MEVSKTLIAAIIVATLSSVAHGAPLKRLPSTAEVLITDVIPPILANATQEVWRESASLSFLARYWGNKSIQYSRQLIQNSRVLFPSFCFLLPYSVSEENRRVWGSNPKLWPNQNIIKVNLAWAASCFLFCTFSSIKMSEEKLFLSFIWPRFFGIDDTGTMHLHLF